MDRSYWHKQTKDRPLFPDLLWSRPENKSHAGKLLVIGGNLHGFSAPAEAYRVAQTAGAGSVRVLLPNSLKKTVGRIIEHGEYAPSTPSGSFAKAALAAALEQAAWADGVLLAGDLGRNSETAVLISSLLQRYSGQVTLVKDAVDYVTSAPDALTGRQVTTLVLTIAQLQRLLTTLKWPKAVTFTMPLLQLVDLLHELTKAHPFNIIVKQDAIMLVACGGQVSSTTLSDNKEPWRVATAAYAAVWWLQNPGKPFEALTTAVTDFIRS